ncbi:MULTISPECIES: anhydro-N-acetylmuramic acid kinase [Alteromonadaceae]|uniref:anhydro-N-acetylmuramic acid kinase n=1 Tax=Alteromonadaceae TaxID=72275 RepID=UPI0026DCAAC3|nr:anhydro-N-acetylmuramic acid kinase [Alteromonas sp. LMIT006]
MSLYIGIMSGTSVDGIDIALCDIEHLPQWRITLDAYQEFPFPTECVSQIESLFSSSDNEVELMGRLHRRLGECYAEAVNQFIQSHAIDKSQIKGIGLHGQTIRHRPSPPNAFTLQIGDAHTVASLTGLPVIYDFRSKDIALGGQGAPLVPPFHHALMQNLASVSPIAKDACQILINLGGIANVTVVQKDGLVGFDTGPANALLDAWYQYHHPSELQRFDRDGVWSKSGNVLPNLLQMMLEDPYFSKPPPKSSGKEVFNLDWIKQRISGKERAEDVQATLLSLTVKTIISALAPWLSAGVSVYLCGGGARNHALCQRLTVSCHTYQSTCKVLNNSDAIEAMAFAWLAYCYDATLNSNCPNVTGASRATVLGARVLP